MRRFCVKNIDENAKILWLNSEESRHAIKVLRLKKNDTIQIFDSHGYEFEAKIIDVTPEGKAAVEILKKIKKKASTDNLNIHVCQGYLQKQKMDWIVEKACEIGIASLTPFKCQYSMVSPSQEAVKKISNRWHRILDQASKQSGNTKGVIIEDVTDFGGVLDKSKQFDLKFLFHPENAEYSIKQALLRVDEEKVREKNKSVDVLLIIGPEGGFSESEIDLAKKEHISTITLNQNILRADTAFAVLSGIFTLIH